MRRYLIVDDNAAFADNLAEILGDGGEAEAVVADSGPRGLAALATGRFDALVSDMRMPEMNGAELVHRIRRIDPGLPAVVVTAYTGGDDLAAARREGVLGVLPKPVPMARLVELLRCARRDALLALVEDDVALADNLTEALRQRGFTAVTARSVLDTERLGVTPFCALVDLRLPGGKDGAALERLTVRFPELPLLVITAYAGRVSLPPTARVFEKPFDSAALLDAVEALHRAAAGGRRG
jgi:CheY-like chemotaxis protein